MNPIALSAVLAVLFAAPNAQASAAKVGEPAPAFTLTDSNGVTHSLADFAGKTVILEWTNHECPFVVKHYGAKNMQAQQRSATEAGAIWLTLNSSAPGKQGNVDAAKANALRAEHAAAATAYLFDTSGDTGRAYGAKTTPHMYVIDPQGVLRYAGAIDSIPSANQADIPKAEQYVNVALGELAAGQAVSTPLTQPYGCSIKY